MRKSALLWTLVAVVAAGSATAYGDLLSESFEDSAFPPAGWTWEGLNVQPYTWHQGSNDSTGWPTAYGTYFARADMPFNHLGTDEWLVSPTLNTTAAGVAVMGQTLGSQQQYSWGAYDLELWVINGELVNDGDDVRVGSLGSFWEAGAFHWVPFTLSLDGFVTPGQDFRVAFRHIQLGTGSVNTAALDAIAVTPEPATFALLTLGGVLLAGRRRA